MGSNDPLEITGQADFEIELFRTDVFDEDGNLSFTIEFVCTCGMPVAKIEELDHFYCIHCDRGCDKGVKECKFCLFAMMDRYTDDYEEEEDTEEEEY